jgi:hypothetical protein
MTYANLLAFLRNLIEAPGTTTYSDAKLLTLLDAIYKEMVTKLDVAKKPHAVSSTTITITTSTLIYGNIPANRRLIKCIDLDSEDVIKIVPHIEEVYTGDECEDRAWYDKANNRLQFIRYPRRSGTYTLYYTLPITDIDTDEIRDIPADYHHIIAYGAASLVRGIETDLVRQIWENKYQAGLRDMIEGEVGTETEIPAVRDVAGW